VAAALASLATLVLGWALFTVDLTLAYVAETTSRATPWPYRVAAVWGGMDGSMLFYATMTTVIAAYAWRKRVAGVAMRIAAGMASALLVFTAVFANPFVVLDIPAVDGVGLLAILQHPAMIYHPPILYLGLTILLVPFALGVEGALTRGRWNVGEARRWLLASWTLLTFGMVAGSSWAYVELGWGGFWAWDPVENTALMPWMAVTAFLHVSPVTERDGRLARSTKALVLVPFGLSVLGVYLTRSGLTGSIHSFAEDPVVGRILLGAAVLTMLAAVAVAVRSSPGPPFGRLGTGRDVWLASNGLLVAMALVFVIIGSAYPAYARVFFGEDVGIDPTFFVATVYPLALLITTGLALALRTRWSGSNVEMRDWVTLAVIAAAVAISVSVSSGWASWPAAAGMGVAVGAMALLLVDLLRWRPRGRRLAAHLAHLGIALVVFGAAGSALGADFSGTMRPGESVEVGGHTVHLEGIVTGEQGRIVYARSVFVVDGEARLEPEIRAYEGQAVPISEPALRSTPGSDLIVATSLLFPDAAAVDVSVHVRPLVTWVWLGSVFLGISGLVGLAGRAEDGAGRRRSATEVRPTAETASGRSAR
jgi:cytochrome c-type biogenesis protein CcmF